MNDALRKVPTKFDSIVEEILRESESIEGYLSPREIRFLALLAACPTAEGEILEIGSFKGKSTVILAKASKLAGEEKIHAVDPMTAPSITDPDLRGEATSFTDFEKNIKTHQVAERIEFHKTFSHELAGKWHRPLRLLWIDGDHTYEGTKLDFDGFAPHLADRAIVAIHDVLHEFEGGVRVFMEDILLSPNFGACGFCGSIGWAQFRKDKTGGILFRREKFTLYRRLSRLIPFIVFKEELRGFEKKLFKLYRSRIPHGEVNPGEWLKMVM